mmetsp:Transcript_28859/g.72399  ORF Transcript_28859/g.72399 Transcript_28859/m.72399 type:complete len:288 (+) Transcript_28859:313-1176(+)
MDRAGSDKDGAGSSKPAGGGDAAGAKGKQPLQREQESLGWLAQSSVQPRKRKDIEGVGASSIVDLKAQLYRGQEEARLRAEGVLDPTDSTTRRRVGVDVTRFNRRNAGVDARNERDMEEVQRAKDRIGECYAALERKAKLYEQIVRGEAPDREDVYQVDFLQKGTLEQEEEVLRGRAESFLAATLGGQPDARSDSDDTKDGEAAARDTAAEDDSGWGHNAVAGRKERIQVISELARETESGRDKAEQLKQARTDQLQRNRQRLKAEFLKRQAAKMRAAKQSAGSGGQ